MSERNTNGRVEESICGWWEREREIFYVGETSLRLFLFENPKLISFCNTRELLVCLGNTTVALAAHKKGW
jgi:hypothetical protein